MITLHFPHWNDISQYIKTAPLLEKNPSSFDAAVEAAEDASPRLFPNKTTNQTLILLKIMINTNLIKL